MNDENEIPDPSYSNDKKDYAPTNSPNKTVCHYS